jgi:hypothetical protein
MNREPDFECQDQSAVVINEGNATVSAGGLCSVGAQDEQRRPRRPPDVAPGVAAHRQRRALKVSIQQAEGSLGTLTAAGCIVGFNSFARHPLHSKET